MTGPGEPEEVPTTESSTNTPQFPVDFGTTSPGSGPFWVSDPEEEESVSGPPHEPHPVTEGTMSGGPGEEGVSFEPIEFDEQYRQDFTGLCFLGKVTDDFEYFGHRFKIRSLKIEELIEIGLLHAKYQNTLADVKAYQTLVAAAAIETVDNRELPIPIGPSESLIEARFNYIQKNWYPFTIDEVYSHYVVLEARVQASVTAVGKAPGSAVLTPG